ncbi:MAG TPA: methyltransferase domain-containing protein [Patescibacteria group bacterium]|nr:methyltransferase domain-containing protein [Patescibacteria group bacterium]
MSINSKVFDKNYYYHVCLGSEEFKKSGGNQLHPKVKNMIDRLSLKKTMTVLEIGCGRGDTALYVAKKVTSVTAIDYSSDAITIAKGIQKKQKKDIQQRTQFYKMAATNLHFKDNSFDFILFIDTIDHLNKKEQKKALQEISRVLKKDGQVFIRTCSNNILLSYTYKYYTYPLNTFLTWIDQKIKNIVYKSLPKDPRTKEEKRQHINELNYFSLYKLVSPFFKKITITAEPGYVKEGKSLRTRLYNFLIAFFPFSQYIPLNILFGHSFLCKLQSLKK